MNTATKQTVLWILPYVICLGSPISVYAESHDFVTTEAPVLLFSVNDGEVASWPPFSEASVKDSITVIIPTGYGPSALAVQVK